MSNKERDIALFSERDLNIASNLKDLLIDFYSTEYDFRKKNWEKVSEGEIVEASLQTAIDGWNEMHDELDAEYEPSPPEPTVEEKPGLERMSYVLDGIKTAMVVRGVGWDGREAACPCGARWEVRPVRGNKPLKIESLRFHYTHCPQARAEEQSE